MTLRHEFTASVYSNQFLCMELFDPQNCAGFYLLFRNGGFGGVLARRRAVFEKKINSRGVAVSSPKPVDGEEDLEAVLKQPFLTEAEIRDRVESWAAAKTEASVGLEPENIAPAVKLTRPLMSSKRAAVSEARKEALRLIKKYDPFRIKIGMTREEVQTLLGPPSFSSPKDGHVLEVYGTYLPGAATLPVATDDPPLTEIDKVFRSVVFENEKATRVFSDHFVDKRLVPSPPQQETEKKKSKK